MKDHNPNQHIINWLRLYRTVQEMRNGEACTLMEAKEAWDRVHPDNRITDLDDTGVDGHFGDAISGRLAWMRAYRAMSGGPSVCSITEAKEACEDYHGWEA